MYMKKDGAVVKMASANQAKMHCSSGSEVVFQTIDCYNGSIEKETDLIHLIDFSEVNPATGPLHIDGAEPGDILKVEILQIVLDDWGCMALMPKGGPLGGFIAEERSKIIPIKNNTAIFNEKIKIPISPMVGVIGTAPATGEVLNGTPGEHGSNMDCNKIQEGTTLYLPVNVPGGLLAIGDLHAVMGDGEVATCAIETRGEVTVKVSVLKNCNLPTPSLRTSEEYIAIASGETLDAASKAAGVKMLEFLQTATELDVYESIMLMSAIGNMEICQVVNPLVTARMTMPQWVLEKYNYLLP